MESSIVGIKIFIDVIQSAILWCTDVLHGYKRKAMSTTIQTKPILPIHTAQKRPGSVR